MTAFLAPATVGGLAYLAPADAQTALTPETPLPPGAITDEQYAEWLDSSAALRVTLFRFYVKSGGAPVVRYLCNGPYNGTSANQYLPLVTGGITTDASISMEANANLAYGDVEFANPNGQYDSWLLDIWKNGRVEVLNGDTNWPETDFRVTYKAVIAGQLNGTKAQDRLVAPIHNVLERLDTPINDVKLGGTGPNKDVVLPVPLGECHNVTPVMTNEATQEFAYGDGVCEGVLTYLKSGLRVYEARTDAKHRTIVDLPATGRFTFPNAVGPGQVTCSVQGAKYNGVYYNTIAKLVEYLVTSRGKLSSRFTLGEIDTANFASFDANHLQPVGLNAPGNMGVMSAIKALASSVGAQLVPTPTGKLQLIQFAIPTEATEDIRASRQVDDTIQLVWQSEIVSAVKVGYCQNYTIQDNLETSITLEHKEMFKEEWFSVTPEDAAVKALYGLDAEPELEPTQLLTEVDANAEALRRLAMRKAPRFTYRFEGTPRNSLLKLGQAVRLFSNRYNLQNGKIGIVSRLRIDWDNMHVIVEVTV